MKFEIENNDYPWIQLDNRVEIVMEQLKQILVGEASIYPNPSIVLQVNVHPIVVFLGMKLTGHKVKEIK